MRPQTGGVIDAAPDLLFLGGLPWCRLLQLIARACP
jgi:hypothetical protein